MKPLPNISLFLALKNALNINSANSNMNVESRVSTKSLMYLTDSVSELDSCFSNHYQIGVSIPPISKPYTTITILTPTKVVPIKRVGLSE